jgi:hypothetical protein
MPIKPLLEAVEESTFIVTVEFFDSDGAAVAPRLVDWTLRDQDYAIVNGRDAVDVPTPGTSIHVALTGDDLTLPDSTKRQRYLFVRAIYDSTVYGDDLHLTEEVRFKIVDCKSHS